jgi:hypothetical protein
VTNDTSSRGLSGFIASVSHLAAGYPLSRTGSQRFILAFGDGYAYIRLADLRHPLRFLRQLSGAPPLQFGTEGFRTALVDDKNPARHYAAFVYVGFWLPGWLALLVLWAWEVAGFVRYAYWSQPDIRSGYVGLYHGRLVRMHGHTILPSLIARDLSQRPLTHRQFSQDPPAHRGQKGGG